MHQPKVEKGHWEDTHSLQSFWVRIFGLWDAAEAKVCGKAQPSLCLSIPETGGSRAVRQEEGGDYRGYLGAGLRTPQGTGHTQGIPPVGSKKVEASSQLLCIWVQGWSQGEHSFSCFRSPWKLGALLGGRWSDTAFLVFPK